MKKSIIPLIVALFGVAHAQEVAVNTLSECIIQEVIPGKQMTGAFFRLNHEGKAQKIVSASIPSITEHVELHAMVEENHVMKMQQIMEYPLQEGENRFMKGSYHLMLLDIPTGSMPAVGSQHKITLTLDDGATISCEANVLSVDKVMSMYQDEMHMHGEHDAHMHGGEHNHMSPDTDNAKMENM